MMSKLRSMFDFQKFAGNESLENVIAETTSRYAQELTDDELENVAAAGIRKRPVRSANEAGNILTNPKRR